VPVTKFIEGGFLMRLLKVLFAVAVLSASLLSIATAKPEYAKKEGKACTFCHVKTGSKELNDAGKYYKEHDHSLKGYKAPQKKS
jgi:cytochrome c553